MKKLGFFTLSALVLTACGSVAVGDSAIVNWGDDGWFKATVVDSCDGGFYVDFENDFYDSDKPKDKICYPVAKITEDNAPKSVKVDDIVLALDEESYYPARVLKVENGLYTVAYLSDLNEVELGLEDLRLKP